ncbi:MAG TPA: UPF0149 family protein [Gammaproteobacteria bacterium]|nr:UPF0149 family protein [Gammaproteobacteria bacterium]
MHATSFTDLKEILNSAGTVCGPAECHGTVCGALCAGADGDEAWLTHLLDEAKGSEASRSAGRRALLELCDLSRSLLQAGTLEFAPLLPDDETGLAERTAELGEWCQGFLYGMGLAGARLQLEALPDEAGEVLRDMGQIAQAGFEGDADDDADEAAYAEIVEYVRVGVQLIYEELQPGTMQPAGTVH